MKISNRFFAFTLAALFSLPAAAVYAANADPGTTTISYNDALSEAIAANSQLKSLQDSVDLTTKQRNNTQASLDFMLSSYGADDPNVRALDRSVNQMNTTINNAPLQAQIIKGSVEVSLLGSLQAIAGSQTDLQTLKESISLAEKNLKNFELKLNFGMVSANDVTHARLSLDQSNAQERQLEQQLASQKIALNYLLGRGPNENITVDYTPQTTPSGFDVERAVKNIPNLADIKLKQSDVDLAQYAVDSDVSANAGISLQEAAQLKQAKRTLADAVSAKEKAIRSAYSNLLALQANERNLETAVQMANAAFTAAVAVFNAGRSTQYDVDTAALNVTQANAAAAKSLYQIAASMYTLNNAYLL